MRYSMFSETSKTVMQSSPCAEMPISTEPPESTENSRPCARRILNGRLSRFTSVIRLMAVILCEEFSPVGMNATNTSRIRWDRQQRRSDSSGSFVVDPIQKFNEPLAIDPKQNFIILWIILWKFLIATTKSGSDVYPNLTVD